MKYKLLIFCISWLIATISNAQLAITWQNCFGGTEYDKPYDIIKNDDSYLIIGYTESSDGDISYNHGEQDVWLIIIDNNGELLHEKTFGGSEGDVGRVILKDSIGYFYLLCEAWSSDYDISNDPYPNSGDFWVVKIDSSWNIIWDKIMGGTWLDRVETGIITNDNCVLAQGHTGSPDGDVSTYFGEYDIWQTKLNNNGEFLWDFTLGTLGFDYGAAVIQTSDNGFLVGGYTRVEDGGGNIDCIPHSWYGEALLVKLDSNRNIEWQQCYGGSENENMFDLIEVVDGYVFLAMTYSNDGDLLNTSYHGESDIWVAKTDFYGNIIWQECYGGTKSEAAKQIFKIDDGGFIIVGQTCSNDGDVSGNHSWSYNHDIWIFKIDDYGLLEWQQCLGGVGDEWLEQGAIKNSNNSFVVAAWTDRGPSYDVACTSYYPGSPDYWIFEVSDTTVGINEVTYSIRSDLMEIYPNPATSTIHITLNESDQSGHISIFNVQSMMIDAYEIKNGISVDVDVSSYAPGIYIAIFQTFDGCIKRSKFVVH